MAVNIAFIGAGRVAQHHCNMLRDVAEANITAICDLQPDRGKPLADAANAPWYENYHDMLNNHSEIDVVTIVTPSGMHYEHAMDVISGYGKNIIVEKPTFMHPEQMRGAYAAAAQNGTEIFPVFQNRYNKAVQRVRQALQSGELGDVQMATVRLRWCRPQPYYDRDPWRGTWSHDGGALTNQGVHYIDLLRYLAGDVAQVNAVCATLGVDVEVEDAVVATVKLESGGLGVIEVTTAARPDDFEASISILGTKGLAVIAGEATNHLITFSPDPSACTEASEDFPIIYGFGHKSLYRDVANVLENGGQFPVSFDDALNTLVFLHSIYRSDEEGGWIDVAESNSSSRLGRPNETVSDLYRTPAPASSAISR
ncbi:Gfo/Idh/MocA family oxidoreductase [Alphaproteobacteria bacterium]|nr:Gfo/Idh/MocA family oxidoreductase [Alphaproteobacteria bacterium]